MSTTTNRPTMFTDNEPDTVLPFELRIVFTTGHPAVTVKGTHDTATGEWLSNIPSGFSESLHSEIQGIVEQAITDFTEIGKPAGDFEHTDFDDEYFCGYWVLAKP